jgi:D-alanyl-lipoteichoic acid acyltransferase DltB (MBOAT superfamily)
MLFNSIAFALFLPLVFMLYWFVFNRSIKQQNLLILVASYFFYGCWDWRFLGLIFISSLSDFILGQRIASANRQPRKKALLVTSLIINLGILGFFKYYNFFTDSFIALFAMGGIELEPSTLVILLPVGISFYTFQTISYTIDIYRGKLQPTKNVIAFFAFVSFFPQLVAGPIERAIDLLPQFMRKRKFNRKQAVSGCRQMLWGLFKKVVIADTLATYVEVIYSNPESHYGLLVLAATVLFTFQVYCDFSGYSDIAIGTAKLFNFQLTMNFRTPLFSKSMKEFWGRWHITLSTWFRDYLYIPMGGNKVSKGRWYFNLFFTFLISGLWHGASWAFAIWGALNGMYLIVEAQTASFFKAFNRMTGLAQLPQLLKLMRMGITFSLFAFSLMIFRAESGEDAWTLITHLPQGWTSQLASVTQAKTSLASLFPDAASTNLLIASFIIFLTGDIIIRNKGIDQSLAILPRKGRIAIYYFVIGWFLMCGAFNEPQEFVYFQF